MVAGAITSEVEAAQTEPDTHLPYNLAGVGIIYHMNEQVTLSPRLQVGLDGRDQTPLANTGSFLLLE